jgi:hypothetical protein
VPVDVADLEVLEVAAEGTIDHVHGQSPAARTAASEAYDP